jgi:hypothetical protein
VKNVSLLEGFVNSTLTPHSSDVKGGSRAIIALA